MTGTAAGQMAAVARFTTTTMFTCRIRRSHQHAATILQDLRLQTVRETAGRVESAGRVELAAQGVLAGPEESADQAELAGPEESADQAELAGPAVSGVQGASADQVELADVLHVERVHPTGWQGHLLGHTTHPRRGSTQQTIRTWLSRISRRQTPSRTVPRLAIRGRIRGKINRPERRRAQPSQRIGWHLIDPRLRIAPTMRRADLVAERIREADAMVHLVAINPVDLRKTRATGAGPALAEAVAEVDSVAGEVAVAAEVVEEAAVDVAEAAAGDDASWRLTSCMSG
jgi:hypothetical protein